MNAEPRDHALSQLIDDCYQQLAAARRLECTLGQRLHALGTLAMHLDHLFSVQLATWFRHGGEEHPPWLLQSLATEIPRLLTEAEKVLHTDLADLLAAHQIRIAAVAQLSPTQQEWLRSYFTHQVYPLLTPLAVDPGHPFPFISSGSMNLAVELQKTSWWSDVTTPLFARVKVPRLIPRLVEVDMSQSRRERVFVLSEDIVRFFITLLFPNMPVRGVYCFRLLRASQSVNEGETRTSAESDIHPQNRVMRLDVEYDVSATVLTWLTHHIAVMPSCLFRCRPPLDLSYLATVRFA